MVENMNKISPGGEKKGMEKKIGKKLVFDCLLQVNYLKQFLETFDRKKCMSLGGV
jgi:hypothetical protein